MLTFYHALKDAVYGDFNKVELFQDSCWEMRSSTNPKVVVPSHPGLHLFSPPPHNPGDFGTTWLY